MRQIIVQVPLDQGQRVLEIAQRFEGINMVRVGGTTASGTEAELVIVHVSNAQVGPLVDALEQVPQLHISFIPSGALALRPPAEEVVDQVTDVAPRSPLEIFVAGLQSIGSWKGFLGYAVVGGAVVWLGLITSTVYLLVGAMLIAPFAGPAVNTAIATARGDLDLLWRSLLRYGTALMVTASVAGLLSLAFRQDAATELMLAVSTISAAAVLLPIMAGAAGALHLCQGEQSSLVSGAAAGMLIAASLAPPAGLIGMAAVAGNHDMLVPALFLLGLQLVGINLSGALVFRFFGLTPSGARFTRGREPVRWISIAASGAALVALLAWQFGSASPMLQHDTVEQRVRDAVTTAVDADSTVDLVEADLRFTRKGRPGQNSLLAEVYVQRRSGTSLTDEMLRAHVRERVRAAIRRQEPNATPLVAVTVLAQQE